MINKQDIIQQIKRFKENAKGRYFLPIPTTIVSMPTVEDAYLQIGRNASDCKSYYDDIAYREDLYDILSSYGLLHDDAFSVMQTVRKGRSRFVRFDDYPIPNELKEWCMGVKYLPSREIVATALADRVNRISDDESLFREALLDTLPEDTYTPMTFIGATDELIDIKKRIYDLSKSKKFYVEEETKFQINDYDIENIPVKIVPITRQTQSLLPPQDVMCEALSKMILRIPIVILIENKCYTTFEEKILNLLDIGIVCKI